MNVMLVSQCSKNALTETRRILDQFAERRGERTWQTPITRQGLETLHKMLRKTARKNTAVACHWLRGRNHSELIWIVGDAGRFNAQGAVPTNTTARDILRTKDENDWHTLEDIRLIAQLAALLHDIGKANQAFQKKLTGKGPVADAYRHEWVSLRLLEAFVGQDSSDQQWLNRLITQSGKNNDAWIEKLVRDGTGGLESSPFKNLPELAKLIGWLIVSHHRMPVQKEPTLNSKTLSRLPETIENQWCGSRPDADAKDVKNCWRFPKKGLPFESSSWRRHVAKTVQTILNRPSLLSQNRFDDPFVRHLSRLALMLADHYYSGEPGRSQDIDFKHQLYANTDRDSGKPKQRLDEHLVGVAVNTRHIVRMLPRLTRHLPRIARHKGFRQRSKDARFRWQDRAFDLACGVRERSERQGFFGVNMASTGCGKTLANGRILYALADPQRGARFCIALGLRTLTLQTGEVYRERMGLGAEDLAVLVGGGAFRDLHDMYSDRDAPTATGSESSEDLLPEHQYVHFEGSLEDGPLNRWLGNNPNTQKLLNAPILVCTIDHLMPATESTRGGHQIAPMLRLMTSDIVLDEPDDFGMEDLPALTRLVHHVGLLGSRLLLSSATLPPSLVQGLFQAYLEGRRSYQCNRGVPGQPLNICCAWFDEFGKESSDHADCDGFRQAHQDFVNKRLKKIAKAEKRRRAEILAVPIVHSQNREIVCKELAEILHRQVHVLHKRHHSVDPATQKSVSFGLIRMANIDPLVETTCALYALGAEEDFGIHLCVYHSQHPLLVRSGIEHRLDRLLNRKDECALFRDPEIRAQSDKKQEKNLIYVVLATAVAEVGRDHDYDWAIVEPSSMRSIIQLAGRVRRHRAGPCEIPNLCLMDVNVRHLENGEGKLAFILPGFESKLFPLDRHHLTDLITPEQLSAIDASHRISERAELHPRNNLADLEHKHLRSLMIGPNPGQPPLLTPVHYWWTTKAMLSGELQRHQPFRMDPQGRRRYGLLPDDDDNIRFHRFERDGTITQVDNLKHCRGVSQGPRIEFWGEPNYEEALETLADTLQMETKDCARRFGVLDLPEKGTEQGWYYHPALGFSHYK